MNEPGPDQKDYLDAAVRKAKPRRCRCGGAAQARAAGGLMWGPAANAVSTTVEYQCPACGRHFRVGLIGDAIGCLIIGAFVGRVGLESLFFGLFLVPLSLFIIFVASNKIWRVLRHPVIQPPPA